MSRGKSKDDPSNQNRNGGQSYPKREYEDAAKKVFNAGLYLTQMPGSRFLF
jgi:hypothetical protein